MVGANTTGDSILLYDAVVQGTFLSTLKRIHNEEYQLCHSLLVWVRTSLPRDDAVHALDNFDY